MSVAGGAAAATGLFVDAHTGVYPPSWAIAGGGPGEQLDLAGTNFRQVALELSSDIPYPAGMAAWREYVVTVEDQPADRTCPPGSVQACKMEITAGQLRGAFATSSFCAWVLDWRQRMIVGDQAAAARDAEVIAGSLRWDAIHALDPQPSTRVPGDLGGVQPSQFGWTLPYMRAVAAGDIGQVNRLIASSNWGAPFWYYDPGFGPGYVMQGGNAGSQYMHHLGQQ